MKKKLYKTISVVMILIMSLGITSCGMIKKDVLYEYTIPENSSVSGKTTAVAETYETMFTGNLLAYNYWRDIAVYTASADTEDAEAGYGLYSYQGDIQMNVSVSANRFTASSASENGEVYFSERDASGTEYVYKADALAEKRTLLAKAEAGKSIVWSVSELDSFVYVDDSNRILRVHEGYESIVFEIPAVYQVSRIRYCEDDKIVMMLAVPQGSTLNNLYRIDLENRIVAAVDVYVSAMSVVTSADKTAYLKTDSRGQRQIYVYDHNTLMREYIIGGNIDRITLSPFGGYVAYSLRSQEGGGGSVWIVNTKNFTNVQITANTTLASDIHWSAGERALIFTQSETNTGAEPLETVYRTYRLGFSYEYTEE